MGVFDRMSIDVSDPQVRAEEQGAGQGSFYDKWNKWELC